MTNKNFVDRHPVGVTVGFVAAVTAVAFFLVFPAREIGMILGWLMIALTAIGVLALCVRIIFRLHQRGQIVRAQIAARADYEHNALLRGDTATGVYGAFRPADL